MELDRSFLKKLWNGEKVMCPKCNKEYLIPLLSYHTRTTIHIFKKNKRINKRIWL